MADRDADNKRDLEMRRFLELTGEVKEDDVYRDEVLYRAKERILRRELKQRSASTDTKDDNPENDVGKEANPNSQQVGVPPNKHGADASFDATQHKISLVIVCLFSLFQLTTAAGSGSKERTNCSRGRPTKGSLSCP
eukprot:759741-Hanusia_phi.AAC.2